MVRRKRMKKCFGMLMSLALLLSPSLVMAGPEGFNVQGRLVDTSGNPISGSQSVQFKIQKLPSGGSAADLWTETKTVTFQNGIYSVTLGSASNPLTDAGGSIFKTNDPLQLVITIGAQVFPAIPIAPTPLAFRAELLGDKSADDFVKKPTGLASGDFVYFDGTDFQRLSLGSQGQVLTVNGGKAIWSDLPDAVLKADFGERGHILVGTGPGTCHSLAAGAAGQVLTSNGTDVIWTTLTNAVPHSLFANNGTIAYGAGGGATGLPIGSSGQVLTVVSGKPQWAAAPSANLSTAVLKADFGGAGHILMGTAPGAYSSVAPGVDNSVLTIVNGLPQWSALPNFVSNNSYSGFGSILFGANGVGTPLPAGAANSILSMDGDGKYPKWIQPNYLSASVFQGSNALVYRTPTGYQSVALGDVDQYLSADANGLVWRNFPTPEKVYGHFQAIANNWGSLQWNAQQQTSGDFTLEDYNDQGNIRTDAVIRFNKTGKYLVMFQFIVNPNYNWNEILMLPRDSATHSNNAVMGTMLNTDQTFNINVSQSASTVLEITSLVNNTNKFRVASAGWGGPGIYANKAFGKIIIIKID